MCDTMIKYIIIIVIQEIHLDVLVAIILITASV